MCAGHKESPRTGSHGGPDPYCCRVRSVAHLPDSPARAAATRHEIFPSLPRVASFTWREGRAPPGRPRTCKHRARPTGGPLLGDYLSAPPIKYEKLFSSGQLALSRVRTVRPTLVTPIPTTLGCKLSKDSRYVVRPSTCSPDGAHCTGACPGCLVYVVGALVRFPTWNTFKTNLKHL